MFPSAMHIAAFEEIVHKLIPSLHHLNAALVSKEQEFSGYAALNPLLIMTTRQKLLRRRIRTA
jgi:aspartate ammonia-lyase